MEERAKTGVSFSPIVILAVLSVVALIGVSAWQGTNWWNSTDIANPEASVVYVVVPEYVSPKSTFDWQGAFEDASASDTEVTAEDPDGLTNIGKNVLGTLVGSYVALKDAGTYTPEQGEAIANTIAADLRADISYRVYGTDDVIIDPDTSFSRMLSYRGDMRTALEPLLRDTTYELETFAYYLDTKNVGYLTELQKKAKDYKVATENARKIVVPQDAASYHIGILNALSEFEATLVQMANHANDPFAAVALLRTFGDAEMRMIVSFDALATYYREHPQT